MAQECSTGVLVIGGGAAAVRAAIEAAKAGQNVALVDKGRVERSGTSPLGLHGMATVLNPETSPEMLVNDVVSAGCGINDVDLVRTAAEASAKEALYLAGLGAEFAKTANGEYDYYQGTGHSARYGLTFSEALTGINFVAVLCKEAWKRGVRLLENIMITDLLVDDGCVVGAVGVDLTGTIWVFKAGAVVLAAGGANRLYPNTAPRIAHPRYRTTGDAYSLALRAGLTLVDMEFANFRETPPAARIGKYVNARGEAFMQRYDPRGERAPRGKVVEALYLELQSGNGPIHVQLDEGAERAVEFMPDEYKSFVRACLEGKCPEVTITFQRLLGGARINPDSSTTIGGLYVAGESAGGFHGADRLQGMAFLETQVYGRLAGTNAAQHASRSQAVPAALVRDAVRRIEARLRQPGKVEASRVIRRVQDVMWSWAGIVRDGNGLEQALQNILECRALALEARGSSAFEPFEAENLALTAYAVISAALARKESRGTHRRSDFPQQDTRMDGKHIGVSYLSDQLVTSIIPSRK